MTRALSVLAAFGAVVATSTPALSHHSSAMFDAAVELELEGAVREFKWSNPHAWIELDVPGEDGTITLWAIEMQPPTMLARRGWKRSSLKPGDQVTVVVNPLRDGQPGGSFVYVTLPDGTELRD